MTITTAFDAEALAFRLYVTSYGRTAPAGPRLFRAPPHPRVRWVHDTQEAAEADAATLRTYLAGLEPQRKGKKKPTGRTAFAD